MKSACDDARKHTTLAWSIGSASRPSGVEATASSRSSAGRPSQWRRMRSVKVTEGAIALTLIPAGPTSVASLAVNAMIPPLAAA